MIWPFQAVFEESIAIAFGKYSLKNGDTIPSIKKIWTNLRVEDGKPTKIFKAFLGEFQNANIIRGKGSSIALP